jgi:hypothetical protein
MVLPMILLPMTITEDPEDWPEFQVWTRPVPKIITEECPEFLEWIRQQRCVRGHWGPCIAHHQQARGHGSKGKKVSDFRAVPMCFDCHALYHQHGRSSFWGSTDFEAVILQLNLDFLLR